MDHHQTQSTSLLKRAAYKGLRGLLVFAQVASTLSATLVGLAQPAALEPLLGVPNVALADVNPGGTTATQIIGTVFQDFNSNGVMNTTGTAPNLAIDVGVSGVTVSAYVSATTPGAAVATATTSASGIYTLTGLTAGTQYRVEFTNLPASYYPSYHGSSGSTTTPSSGTSVQFVAAGTSNVSYGINVPADYVDANPDLASPRYFQKLTGFNTLLSWDYDNRGLVSAGGYIAPTGEATIDEIGTTWGLAYRRSTKDLFAAAFVRRHGSLPDVVSADGTTTAASDSVADLGVIYRVTQDGNTANNTNVRWANLDGATDAASSTIDVGTLGTDSARGINTTGPSNDPTAFDAVGKQGLGDVDISDDESNLWVMNLNQRKLHAIAIQANGSAGTIRSFDIPTAQCNGVGAANDMRPFATKYYRGNVYVGVVCSGENTQLLSSMNAYVFQLPDDGVSTTFTQVLTFSLGYAKQPSDASAGCSAVAYQNWKPWKTTIPGSCNGGGNRQVQPQPILSDIEFDTNGDMIVGLMDRNGHQINTNNYGPTGSTSLDVASAGDALRATRQSSSLWNIETTATDASITTEYYTGDRFTDTGNGDGHLEITLGGLALLPGSGRLVANAFDPVDGAGGAGVYNAGGVIFLNNSTGARTGTTDGYQTFRDTTTGTVGKAAGMGDVELLSDPAPIEIGNRVWRDDNANGIQDPGEPGLSGVLVSLQTPTTTLTTNTATDGTYYFQGLQPNTAYTLTFPTTNGGVPLTDQNATGNSSNSPLTDTIDSDVNAAGVITFSTGNAGENNHTLDVGYGTPPVPQIATLQLVKQVTGGTSLANFPLTVQGPTGTLNVNVTSGAPVVLTGLQPGTYRVSEDTLPGAPSGLQWVGTLYAPGQTLSIGSNQTGTVTVTNQLGPSPTSAGLLTITKSVINSTSSGPYVVTLTGPSYPSGQTFNIISGTNTITNLLSGVYTVTETSPGAGWLTTYTVGSLSSATNGVVTLANAITTTSFTVSQITGTVFADYNENGSYDVSTTYNETGVLGVKITVYDVTGTVIGMTTTVATGLLTGRYTATVSGPGPYRVEFTDLPPGMEPSRVFTSTQNDTSVQFINTAAQASGADFGVNAPCDFCQSNPTLATTTMVAAHQMTNTGATTEASDTVVAFAYNSTTSTGAPTGLAQAQQVGTTYGVAYQRGSKSIFVAAYMKRHAGFGPGGPGAIYRIAPGPDGIAGTNDDVPSTFMVLDSASYFGAGSFGTDPHPTTFEGIAQSPYNWFHDANSLDDVAKMSFGDLDISEDEQELYAVNLANRSLYRIPIGNPPTAPAVGAITVISVPIALPNTGANALAAGAASNQHQTCASADVRPFGLGTYRQKIYMGLVCSAFSTQLAANLRAYVYVFDLATGAFGTAPALEFPLNYTRSGSFASSWRPYMDTFSTIATGTATDGVAVFTNYPQPMLSDIVFDRGQMVLGLRDRASDQLGKYAGDTGSGAPGNFYYLAATGDVLRACGTTGNSWTVENDGTCGGITTTGSASSNAGPGGGEYYLGDLAPYPSGPQHVEASEGSLAQVPGQVEVVMAAIDATGLNSGGIEWLNNNTGALADAYEVYQSTTPSGVPSSPSTSQTPDTTFGKAGGIGDMEALCDPAPIEIGNRVWWDQDGDGVQDAGEPALPGVVVSLTLPNGSVIATTTNINGNYYFTRETTSTGFYTSTSLNQYTAYTITVRADQVALSGYMLTAANAEALSGASVTSNHAISDVRDSDAALTGNLARIVYTTGAAGENNHGLDFGFSKPATGIVVITNTAPVNPAQFGDRVWIESDNDGLASTGTITPVQGMLMTAVGPGGTFTTTTNAQGYYSFTVPAGTYTVTYAAAPAGTAPSATPGGSSESGNAGSYQQAGNPDQSHLNGTTVTVAGGEANWEVDFGFYQLPPNPPTSGVLTVTKQVLNNGGSGPFNITLNGPSGYVSTTTIISGGQVVFAGLAPGLYTVTEVSPGAGWVQTYTVTSGNGITTSANAVVTLTNVITAAAVAPGQITGTVYADFDADGNKDTGEIGVQSVTVTAYDRNGNAVGSTQTSASGVFTFTPSTVGPWRIEFTNLPVGYEPSRVFTGTQNGTSMQFVNSLPVTGGLYFGVNKPCNYCQTNPFLATSIFIAGSGATSTAPALVAWPYTHTGAIDASYRYMGQQQETGSVWGLAYNRSANVLYSAAYLKRHIGLGPGGLGTIYKTTNANGIGGTTSPFFNLASIPGVSVGTVVSRDLNIFTTPSYDPDAWLKVGRVGLGDIDITEDERMLYVVNLYEKKLYAVPTLNPNSSNVQGYAIPDPSCVGGLFEPFALKVITNSVYVGGVCDASTSQVAANLKAVVLRFDTTTNTFAASPVVQYGLLYLTNMTTFAYSWAPWVANYTNGSSHQPMMKDIEFDVDGSIIMGFNDRLGDLLFTGNFMPYPLYPTPSTPESPPFAQLGDLVRACATTSGYTIEFNGTCSGVGGGTGTGGYYGDSDISQGALALKPGSGELVATQTDAFALVSNGVQFWDNKTGQSRRAATVVLDTTTGSVKGAYVGDIELLCDPAPIEIGNRVWQDVNGNGVQDPGEPALAGVAVQLLNPTTGAVLQTVTTNISGTYYFTREAATGAYSQTLRPNTPYSISIALSSVPGYSLTVKDAQAISGATNSNDSILDVRDSDATLLGANAQIYYTTGSYGQNNHGLDFGFVRPTQAAVNITNTPPPANIVVVKYTNGFDADTITGPYLKVGSVVTWTYVITNSGGVTLTNIGLGDSQQGSVSCPQTQLAAGASMTCVLSGIATQGQYTNTAVVTGTPPSGTPVTSTNPSHYFGANPNIVLRKYTNGYDADALPLSCNVAGGQPCVAVGSVVTWTYIVTNTGNMTMNIGIGELSDDKVGPINASAFSLAPGASTLLTKTGIALSGQYTNTGIVTGTPVLPPGVPITPELPGFPPSTPVTNPLTSTNPSHYNVLPQFGDRVWIESDTDGNANTGTLTPVAGMVMTATDGTTVYTTTTNAQGYYSFTVPAGTYTVTYGNVPAVYGPVTPSATPASNSASGNAGSYQQAGNPDQSRPQNSTVTLTAGQSNWTMDYAFNTPLYDVGNRVWFDTNNDGQLGGLEVSVAGVTMQLRDSTGVVIATTTTNASGYYSFTNLPAGTYTVVVAGSNLAPAGPLAGYWNSGPTTASSNTASDNDRDHGVNPMTYAAYLSNGVSSGSITLGVGLPTSEDSGAPSTPNGDARNNLTIDFGFYKQEIGNTIWVDTNDDGLQNNGELPYTAGPITVTLVDNATGTVVSQTVTNNGLYTFTGVQSGTYVVSITVPLNFVSSTPTTNTAGVDTNDNGSTSGAFIVSAPFTATPGTNVGSIASNNTNGTTVNPSIDFGLMQPPVQFGDRVWIETDTDGNANTGTITPVAGMLMTATSGANVYTTTTNAQGYYSFTVPAGTYTVTYGAVPPGYGTVQPSSTPGSATLSGNSGSYQQSGNPDQSHPQNTVVTLTPGQANWQVDFGFNPPLAQFGDRVWIESDTDGLASTGTITPVAGMLMTATSGANVYTTTTNAQGYYSFTVSAGTYAVTYGVVPAVYGLVLPSGTPGGGSESGNAGTYQQSGNPDQSHINNTTVTVAAGQANWLVDFAFNPPQSSIQVKKYTNGFDADTVTGPFIKPGAAITWTYVVTNNGNVTLTNVTLVDSIEGSVTCTPTTLTPGQGTTCTATGTATTGQYTNTAVVTGTPPVGPPVTSTNPSHYFGVDPQIVVRKYTNGFDADTLADPRAVLPPGAAVTWRYVVTNTGNVPLTMTLTDDRISLVGASCAPVSNGQVLAVAGVTTCTLISTAQVTQTTSGLYTNTATVTGTVVMPPGTPITPELPGFPVLPPTQPPLTSTNPSHYNVLPQFGDRVWIESDKDGVASTGTITPVAGMVITATDGTNTYTATTDVAGYYSFTVPAGTYTVTYGSVPAVYGNVVPSSTPASSSTSGNAGSYQQAGNPDQSRPQNSTVTLTAGQSNWTLDYAFNVALYDLGNKIWFDTNNDGQLGGLEVSVAGVTMQLRDSGGAVIATTTTNAQGYYSFTNLLAGVYSVTVAGSNFAPGGILAGYWNSSPTTAPSNNASDNDRDHGVNPATYAAYLANGVSSGPITLGTGLPTSEDSSAPSTPNGDVRNNLTIDFGFYKQEIGNRVWYDNDGNGLDGNEPPVANIPVTLTDSLGNVLSTTTTNAQGYYTFTGVPSGSFIVQILAPAGYDSTDPDDTTGNTDLNDNGQGSTNGVISSQVFTMTPGTNSGAIFSTNTDGTTRNPSIDFGLVRAGIDVVKYTNGYNADTLSDPRVRLLPGDPVTWTYVIRNTGSTALTNIQLSDDRVSTAGASCAPVALGGTLSAGGITTCTVNGFASAAQTVNGIYTNTATIQGNPPSGPPLTGTNPSHYQVITPSIGLRKYTNGYDADTLSDLRPQLRDGAPVTWTYVVTNTGNVPLSNLTLNDDRANLTSANCAPVALGGALAVGQVTTCTLSSNAQAAATVNGIYTNTAVVTGTPSLPTLPPPDLPTFPPPPTSTVPLTATNPSHYEVITPSIKVTKYTVGFDADALGDVRPVLRIGDGVTWTYLVTNTGNVTLNPVVLTDDREGAITCPQTSLIAGASMTCTRTGTVQAASVDAAGLYTNTAIVTGTPPIQPPPPPIFPPPPPPPVVTGTNPSHYEVVTPSIALVKYTNGYDADTLADARALLRDGDPVLWTYVIRNTGNVALSNLTLGDDRISTAGATCAPVALGGTLAVSGVTTCSVSSTAQATQTVGNIYTNTANTSGTPVVPPGNPVLPPLTATNPSHYEIFTPTVTLKKYTNGLDADTAADPQPVLNLNDSVVWTYVFTNTSAVSLTNLALVDDREGNLNPRASCSPIALGGTLLPGQSTTCTLNGNATGGQYVNNATVYGTPVLPPPPPPQFPPPPPQPPVTSTNPSRYFGAGPGIVVRKYTNGYDADVIPFDPQPFVLVGQPVVWTYVINNTGNVTLTNVTLNDDVIGSLNSNVNASCAPLSLSDPFVPGAVTTCTLPSTASVTGQYTNTASVTGTNQLSPTQMVTGTNPSHYFGATPKIDVRKYTNGFDADTMNDPRTWLRNGDAVMWTYIVSNTGNVDLTNLTLSDDRVNTAGASCTPVALGGTLAVGAVTTCTLPALAQANQTANGVYTNTAVVTGTPPIQPPPTIPTFPPTPPLPPPTATNPSHYEVVTPSIVLTKWTNGYDADVLSDPQAQLVLGAAVTWTYRVTNTGTITLTNLTLVDDKEGGVVCPQSTLLPGESMVCVRMGIASLGQYTNTGLVTGTPTVPPYTPTLPGAPPPSLFPPVTSTNPSHYTGVTAGLGDYVWEDLDHDGYQDPNEPGITGVSVSLLDGSGNVLRTTTTDASGYYSFTNLIPGEPYVVQFGTPNGYQPTTQNADSLGLNGAKNSDASPTTGKTVSVILGANEFNPNLDAGFWRPASLGNYVWFDDDKDGTQDASETGVPGVRVNLLDASSNLIRTTTTDAFGYYLFTNLIPGSYSVQFDVSTLPTGYAPTTRGATGGKDGPDSDPDPVTGRTELIPLSAGENDPTWDMGIVPQLAGLGNYVWSDNDRDGIQDANEVPVPGVLVTLYDAGGNPISTTTTNVAGFYVFTGLVPGTYSVGFTAPNGFTFTTPGSTPISDNDSNANPQTGRTAPVTLTPGEYNPTIDAGLVPLASLGDFVWNDRDRDGTQDPGETGVPGVSVVLKDGNGQVVATTTTDASGAYSFTNLIPGTYVVVFTIPQGYTFTKPNVGADGTDSDATPTQDALIGVSPPVTLLPGENNPTIDAGVWVPARLGDFVWFDVNRNGVQDATEVGVPGVTVTLYQRGTAISTTVTTADGRYLFDNLVPEEYYVVFTLPNGYTFTQQVAGVPGTDSNANPLTGQSATTTIEPGEDDRTWDAGIWYPLPTLHLKKTLKTKNATVQVGELITYTVVVSNSGPGIVKNLVITDPIPSGIEYVAGSAVPAAQFANNTLRWTKATLGVNERYTVTFRAKVLASVSQTETQILNVAYTSGEAGSVPVNAPTPPLQDDDQASVPRGPTAITLKLFEAKWLSSTVLIRWETGSEENTFGFVLYRGETTDRSRAVRITKDAIPAQVGNGGGASYAYEDETVTVGNAPNKVYYYWLQEVETDGDTTDYGPVATNAKPVVKPTRFITFLPLVSKSK